MIQYSVLVISAITDLFIYPFVDIRYLMYLPYFYTFDYLCRHLTLT